MLRAKYYWFEPYVMLLIAIAAMLPILIMKMGGINHVLYGFDFFELCFAIGWVATDLIFLILFAFIIPFSAFWVSNFFSKEKKKYSWDVSWGLLILLIHFLYIHNGAKP